MILHKNHKYTDFIFNFLKKYVDKINQFIRGFIFYWLVLRIIYNEFILSFSGGLEVIYMYQML